MGFPASQSYGHFRQESHGGSIDGRLTGQRAPITRSKASRQCPGSLARGCVDLLVNLFGCAASKSTTTHQGNDGSSNGTFVTRKWASTKECRHRNAHHSKGEHAKAEAFWVAAHAKWSAESSAWSVCAGRNLRRTSDRSPVARQGYSCEFWSGDRLRPRGRRTHGHDLVADCSTPGGGGTDLA